MRESDLAGAEFRVERVSHFAFAKYTSYTKIGGTARFLDQ